MFNRDYDFIFWGASGHALVLADIVRTHGKRVLAVFDNNPEQASPLPGVPVYHGKEGYEKWVHCNKGIGPIAATSAIGGARGKDRCQYLSLFKSTGFLTPVLVHQRAFVAPSAILGENSQVLAMAVVNSCALVGEATIINTNASIDHECELGNGVHVAPGATLCGCVKVGSYTLIGPGSVLLPQLRIGSNVIIGAGSVVTRDIPDNMVAFGNPARIIRDNKHDGF